MSTFTCKISAAPARKGYKIKSEDQPRRIQPIHIISSLMAVVQLPSTVSFAPCSLLRACLVVDSLCR